MVENLGQRHNACPPVYPISILGSFGTAMGPTRIHVQTLPIYSGYVRQCQYIQSDPNCPRQVSIFQNHYEVNFLPFTQMFKNGFCLVYPFRSRGTLISVRLWNFKDFKFRIHHL